MNRRATILGVGSLLTLVLLMVAETTRAGNTWLVWPGGDGSDGLTWPTAFTTIPDGLSAAASGDTVLCSNGTYYLAGTITVPSGLTVASASGPGATIVDGQYPVLSNRCFTLSGSAVVDGFTIRNGYAADHGGGAFLNGGGTLTGCILTNNAAYSRGGGCYATGGLVTNCLITGNSLLYNVSANTTAGGGGAFLSSAGRMIACTVEHNVSGYYAGGVKVMGSQARLLDSIIRNNTAVYGGGVRVYANNADGGLVANCDVTGNQAAYGGGVHMYGLDNTGGTVSNLTIHGNTGTSAGGGIAFYKGGTATHCRIFQNTANNRGGGAYLEEKGVLQHSVIISNTCNDLFQPANEENGGGGVYVNNWYSRLGLVSNCLIACNQVVRKAGGLYVRISGTIVDCVISNNATTLATGFCGGALLSNSSPGGEIVNCRIVDNVASSMAGARCAYGLMTGCLVQGNRATNTASAIAGGVDIRNTLGVVSNCVIAGNTSAYDAGGAYIGSGGTLVDSVVSNNVAQRSSGGGIRFASTGGTAERCRIVRNVATASAGGGVYGDTGMLLRNCLVAENLSGGHGGGIRMTGSSNMRLENCTFARNQAAVNGGGVYCQNGAFTNCIIYYNRALGSGQDTYSTIGFANFAYSCSPDIAGGTANRTAAPGFVAAGSGYGTNSVPGNYRLQRGAPGCIGKGTLLPWMTTAAIDLDGAARVSPEAGRVDMGCYETWLPVGSVLQLR